MTKEPPPALTGVHPDLAAVCLHCLQKDPSRRYATAGALADDLDHFLNDEPPSILPLGPGARWLRSARRNPLLTLGLLGTLLSPAYKNYSRRACCASLPRSDTMFMSVWTLADRSMIYPVVGEE